jgi:hypothetical protein
MWDSLLNYGRMEWKHTLAMIQKYLEKKGKLLEVFDKIILLALNYLYYGWKEVYVVLPIISLL